MFIPCQGALRCQLRVPPVQQGGAGAAARIECPERLGPPVGHVVCPCANSPSPSRRAYSRGLRPTRPRGQPSHCLTARPRRHRRRRPLLQSVPSVASMQTATATAVALVDRGTARAATVSNTRHKRGSSHARASLPRKSTPREKSRRGEKERNTHGRSTTSHRQSRSSCQSRSIRLWYGMPRWRRS